MGRLSSEAPTSPAQSCAACPWACPCDPQSCEAFKMRHGSHCLQPLFLLPDSSHPEASLVVALVSPWTAVLLLDSAAACPLLDRRASHLALLSSSVLSRYLTVSSQQHWKGELWLQSSADGDMREVGQMCQVPQPCSPAARPTAAASLEVTSVPRYLWGGPGSARGALSSYQSWQLAYGS